MPGVVEVTGNPVPKRTIRPETGDLIGHVPRKVLGLGLVSVGKS